MASIDRAWAARMQKRKSNGQTRLSRMFERIELELKSRIENRSVVLT
jgi:hypothetical protein